MTVIVRLFAYYAEKLGQTELRLDLRDGATVSDVLASIATLPGGDALPPRPLVAVNRTYSLTTTTLNDGDEVAIIPPVAGG